MEKIGKQMRYALTPGCSMWAPSQVIEKIAVEATGHVLETAPDSPLETAPDAPLSTSMPAIKGRPFRDF